MKAGMAKEYSDHTATDMAEGAPAKAILHVPGMCSDHCAAIAPTSLLRNEGVGDVRVSSGRHRAEVWYDGQIVSMP